MVSSPGLPWSLAVINVGSALLTVRDALDGLAASLPRHLLVKDALIITVCMRFLGMLTHSARGRSGVEVIVAWCNGPVAPFPFFHRNHIFYTTDWGQRMG